MSDHEDFTDAELAAYVAEALDVQRTTRLEATLRRSPALQSRLAELLATQGQAAADIAEIWRLRRLACPSRQTWLAYLDGRIGGEFREYLRFHLDDVGCRFCAANVADLQVAETPGAAERVRKFFETSVGRLRDVPSE